MIFIEEDSMILRLSQKLILYLINLTSFLSFYLIFPLYFSSLSKLVSCCKLGILIFILLYFEFFYFLSEYNLDFTYIFSCSMIYLLILINFYGFSYYSILVIDLWPSGYERGLTTFCKFVKIRVLVGISVFARVLLYRTFVHF